MAKLTQTQMLLARLKAFTADCRPDMHEPDEQGITAVVKGKSFDNAYSNEAFMQNEIIVHLKQTGGFQLSINLCNLIALARLVTPEQAATLDR